MLKHPTVEEYIDYIESKGESLVEVIDREALEKARNLDKGYFERLHLSTLKL